MTSADLDHADSQPGPVEPPKQHGLFRRLAGGTLNYGIGSMLPQVIGFFLIPVYTAFLSPTDYGILEMAATFGATLVIVMRMGIPGVVSLFYYDYGETPSLSDYVTTVARAVNLASLVVGLFVLLIAPWTFVPWMQLPWYPFVILVVAIQWFSGNSDLQRRLIQAREQSAYSAKLSVAIALSNIALAVLFVAGFRWGAVGMLLAQLICAVVFFAQAQHYLWPNLGGRFSGTMLRSSFTHGMGILPGQLLTAGTPLLTRIILTQVDSMAAVGVFALANKMASPLTTVLISAFRMAYLPLYFSIRKEAREDSLQQLAAASRHVWLAAMMCFLAVSLLGPPAIVIMTPARYHDAGPLVPILCVGFLAQTGRALLAPEIFYSKRTWLVSAVTLASLVASLAAAILLTPVYGPAGIAWATTLGAVAGMIAAMYFSMQTVRVPHNWPAIVRTTAVGAAVFATGRGAGGDNPWQQVAVGLGVLLAMPVILWLVGDPAVQESWQFARRFVAGKKQ